MRLLVVSGSPPASSRSLSPMRSSTAQPPGPGFPRHAPSVNISTSGSSLTSGDELARELEHHSLRRVTGFLLSYFKPLPERVDDFAPQHCGGGGAGGDPDRRRLSEPLPINVFGALDETRRNAHPLGDFGEAQRIAAVG